jgi:DNA-binding HxlR family transcriptional regulator
LSTYVVLNERINQLRSIEKLVDISKSTIQIDIMLTLNKGNKTSAEIAKEIGQRRKAVTDAMRKLRLKGLVNGVEEDQNLKSSRYKLTLSGFSCLNTLLELTGSAKDHIGEKIGHLRDYGAIRNIDDDPEIQSPSGSLIETQNDINAFPIAAVVSELILILGTVKGNIMSRKDLANAVGLSEQRTESYIEVYLNGSTKLFRKYTDAPKIVRLMAKFGLRSKTKKTETIYGLTNEGIQHFYKLPTYTKLKQSATYKLFSKITFSSQPKNIFKRLNMMLFVGGATTIALFQYPFNSLTSGIWVFIIAFVAAVTLLDTLMYKLM